MLTLKKAIIYFLTACFVICATDLLTGCNPQPEGESKESKTGDFIIKTIDGCEYIEYDYGLYHQRVYSLTHKGNCSNPIHNYNKLK